MIAQPRQFWLTAVLIVMAILTGCFAPNDVEQLPGGFESPVLALQLARSVEDAAAVADGQARRASFEKSIYADFVLILTYALLWFLMVRRVSAILAIVVLLAGAGDVIENLGMLMTLNSSTPSPSMVHWTYFASSSKWLLLVVVFIALFFYFRPRQGFRNGWEVVKLGTGLAYAYSAVLCVVGVFLSNPVIERSLLPLSVALILQLVLSLLLPKELMSFHSGTTARNVIGRLLYKGKKHPGPAA